jgi:putative SOS response-associated peptidase YedK
MINARAETLTEKPAYRSLIGRHRCLIPADGFYEWTVGADGGFAVGADQTPGYHRGLHQASTSGLGTGSCRVPIHLRVDAADRVLRSRTSRPRLD